MYAGPPKTTLCGAEIQGELSMDGIPPGTQVDTCVLGVPAASPCFEGSAATKAVYFSLPKDLDPNAAVLVDDGAIANPSNYVSTFEILWCPSNDTEAQFITYEACGAQRPLEFLYTGAQYGYIPVVKISEYPNPTTEPKCATISVIAAQFA